MKHVSTYNKVGAATLQDIIDRIAANSDIADTRKRDLRSAILSFGKLANRAPASIPLELGELRRVLDDTDGTVAQVSSKRRANLRSDLTAAIDASGLYPMLKTGRLDFNAAWKALLDPINNPCIRNGLSRLARWCSLNSIAPEAVNEAIVDRFVQDLEARTLIRNVADRRVGVVSAWNRLVAMQPDLSEIAAPARSKVFKRVPWDGSPRHSSPTSKLSLPGPLYPIPSTITPGPRDWRQRNSKLRRRSSRRLKRLRMARRMQKRRMMKQLPDWMGS